MRYSLLSLPRRACVFQALIRSLFLFQLIFFSERLFHIEKQDVDGPAAPLVLREELLHPELLVEELRVEPRRRALLHLSSAQASTALASKVWR